MPHHDELLNFAEELLSESPTPGEKRGDYENSKLRKSKMSTKAAKKAGSDVLRGIASRGGASVSVANTELKRRKDSESSSDDPGDISADEKENKDKFESDAEEAVDEVEDIIDGEDDLDIPSDLPDDMEDPEVRNRFKDFFEKTKLGRALSAFFDTEPSPFPGMEDKKAEFLTKAKDMVIDARDKQIEKGSEKREKEKAEKDKEKERESTFRGMSVDELEKILDDPDTSKENKKVARRILKDKKKDKTKKEHLEYKNLHTMIREITNGRS